MNINIPDISNWFSVNRMLISGGLTFVTNIILKVFYADWYGIIITPDHYLLSQLGLLLLIYTILHSLFSLYLKIFKLFYWVEKKIHPQKHTSLSR